MAAGCGGAGGAETPLLPGDLADSLAVRSDAVAEALEAGDPCGASDRARQLQGAAVRAINAGRIPDVYLEELSASVNELAAATASQCAAKAPAPPPASTTTEQTQTEETQPEETEGEEPEEEPEETEEDEPEITLTLPTEPDEDGDNGRGNDDKKKRKDKGS